MGNRNSGRRPKPTALKVLQGNPGQRKLNEREPKPPMGPPRIPKMSAAARDIWDEVAPMAIAMGTLTSIDGKAFAAYCELQATLDRACAEKDVEGFTPFLMTLVSDANGNEYYKASEHPAIKLERNTAGALRPYFEKFGLEPVGRARISVPKANEPENEWVAMGIA